MNRFDQGSIISLFVRLLLSIMREPFRVLILLVAFSCCMRYLHAQSVISEEKLTELNKFQDTLKILGDSMLDARDEMMRQSSCYQFIKTMVRALKVEGSYHFTFDSLQRISILYPQDQSFRVFTWALRYDAGTYRYYGTLQMNDPEELKLYPLYDYSDLIRKPLDTITSHAKWVGALYYKLIGMKSQSGKTYYTLLGWDGNDKNSNKKIVEVLSFNSKKVPVFGGSVFDFGKLDERNKLKRFSIEYKEDAKVSMNYDPEMQMIIFDHLVPESSSAKGEYKTYVPDGSYEGFRWEEGKWRYVENVFTTTQREPPFPNPVDFDKEKAPKMH